ncbi:MAG: 4-hydroxyphenylacetate 3-monooxygenase, oxygenase component [Chloroflexi bacterium]|jgi:4-hydroxyphenylacetate 3-monooxygenase|nr:4-hydroxyphenylacetate 3-monooxygenase, oxygenase component [Chloroflexota bacterium]MDP6497679.1 4-hydroxyphenylacetate 3-monooxygenase, oxygenase component [Dehalococcoidia bacterium]MQG53470.1 4-hydroxyphenylacetate 3-monooxygenase, oxygenase component [SAR202 cluster bacterium]|tara:strand:+ start:1264 stop:2718 length:1455 start_codon:yes stop_codon:yes gene_type:complete
MPARTGQQYIDGLSKNPAEVWISGEKVKDVTTHPAFQNGVRSLAALYDQQHDPATKDAMTFKSPSSGDQVGLSFIIPKTIDDLVKRREMMTNWAWESCGMMARTPDFLNNAVSGWAGSSDYFLDNRPEFKDNVLRYHEHIRENDLTLTHTLVNLQRSRNAAVVDNIEEQVALTVVKETDAGIVVHGSRILATLGPISDEIAVYPTRTHILGKDAWRQAFSFALPCATPGMKFMCRESLDLGRSSFDHPLGARFEEMDALVFFDNVLVPWERVFLLGDVDMCNDYAAATQSTSHTGQQVVNRTVVKTEFILGLASLMAETLGSTEVPHVQERIGEIVVYLETLKACVRAAEADAKLNQWGVMCPAQGPLVAGRNLYAKVIYARLAEIVQLLGSSSLMALPTEADFDTPISPDLERYLATDTTGAKDRVRLFHLAWDVACSAFGGRQVLYERFFGGDPVRNAILLYQSYDKTHAMDRVQWFLEREG